MTCEEFRSLTTAGGKMPNQMTRAERAAVINHARICEDCRVALKRAAESFVRITKATDPGRMEVLENFNKTVINPMLTDDLNDEEFVKTATGKSL